MCPRIWPIEDICVGLYVLKRLLTVWHILEKVMSMQHSFEAFSEKQRRVELKSVGNFVAKTVLVESANQFSLEELCRTQYSLKIFFSKPCRPSFLWQNLKCLSFHIVRWLAMSDLLGLWFKLAWVVFTECKQTSSVHVYDWINEPGLCHRAVTSTFTLPTGILSVLTQDFGIDYINNFLHWSAKKIHSLYGETYMHKGPKKPKADKKKVELDF